MGNRPYCGVRGRPHSYRAVDFFSRDRHEFDVSATDASQQRHYVTSSQSQQLYRWTDRLTTVVSHFISTGGPPCRPLVRWFAWNPIDSSCMACCARSTIVPYARRGTLKIAFSLEHNKKLGSAVYSAICEPSTAEISAASCNTSTCLPRRNSASWDILPYPGRLWHTDRRYIDLSCHVPSSTFCCTTWSQSIIVIDGRTDGQTDAMLAATR